MITLKEKLSSDKGFTLIELLVVILIIGILAAIALPSLLGQRDKAFNSGLTSDVRNAVVTVKSISTDQEGSYTGIDSADIAAAEQSLTGKVEVRGTPGTTINLCSVPVGKGSEAGNKRCVTLGTGAETPGWLDSTAVTALGAAS